MGQVSPDIVKEIQMEPVISPGCNRLTLGQTKARKTRTLKKTNKQTNNFGTELR